MSSTCLFMLDGVEVWRGGVEMDGRIAACTVAEVLETEATTRCTAAGIWRDGVVVIVIGRGLLLLYGGT